MRRRGRHLLCPARLSVHRRVHVGQARVPGLYRVVLVGRARQVTVRPGRVGWLVPWVAGCLRVRSQADPVDRVLLAVARTALHRPGRARVQARDRLPVA